MISINFKHNVFINRSNSDLLLGNLFAAQWLIRPLSANYVNQEITPIDWTSYLLKILSGGLPYNNVLNPVTNPNIIKDPSIIDSGHPENSNVNVNVNVKVL